MAVPEILTPRLRLRDWADDDVEQLADIYADPESVRYLQPLDLEGTRRQVERIKAHWLEHDFGLWALEERATGRFIGRVGLMHHATWSATAHDAEVGWVIARDLWGKGLATEGGAAALNFGFTTRKMRRIISIAHRDNAASQRVMAKLGMSREGETDWRGLPVVWYAIEAAPAE